MRVADRHRTDNGVRARVAAGLLAAVLALAGCGGGEATGAEPALSAGPVPTVRAGALCLTPTEQRGVVRFTSQNGASLGGVVLGSGPTGVVLAHSPSSDLCEWMPYARRLTGLGYRVLAFDLNGFASSGTSPGNPNDARYDQDVLAAAGQLRTRGASTVLLVGSMLGGLAALVAASEAEPPVAGVIDMAGSTTMSGLDTDAAAKRLTVPVLFVAGERDTHVDHPHLRALAAAATRAPEHRVMVVAGSAGHPTNLLDPVQEPQAPAVRAMVEQFLAAHAGR
jgi:pimeloyl-ACP methyl ester carboxylesterase